MDLKEQIQTSIEYFCDISPTDEANKYQTDIPSDSAFKLAFALLFPNLREFCNTFVDFDNISISESNPEGKSAVMEGPNCFHTLEVCLPMETEKFQKEFPTLYYAFSSLSRLEVDVVDETGRKKAISYILTPQVITIQW